MRARWGTESKAFCRSDGLVDSFTIAYAQNSSILHQPITFTEELYIMASFATPFSSLSQHRVNDVTWWWECFLNEKRYGTL